MLGGIIGPIMEEAAVTATENSLSYPSFSMAGKSIPPIAAVRQPQSRTLWQKTRGHNVDLCQRPPHPAYQQFGQEDNVIHQAQPGHQFPCKHKQRDRQQSKAVYALVVLLKNQLKPNLPPDSSGQDRAMPTPKQWAYRKTSAQTAAGTNKRPYSCYYFASFPSRPVNLRMSWQTWLIM